MGNLFQLGNDQQESDKGKKCNLPFIQCKYFAKLQLHNFLSPGKQHETV